MITYSGQHIQKRGGADGTPTIEDIAVQSARICRYGGAIWAPLMPHMIFVGLLAWKRSKSVPNLVWGLLHDAHEIVTNDVPRPFKCDCMRKEQLFIDARIHQMFLASLADESGIDYDLIKQCDIDACHIEAVELGLPGFAETEIKQSTDYTGRTEIHRNDDDRALFRYVHNLAGHPNIVCGIHVPQVQTFVEVLKWAKDGKLNRLKTWAENMTLAEVAK